MEAINKINKKRQQGRRRRGKKDVILDFSKRVTRKRPSEEGESDDESGQVAAIVKPKQLIKANNIKATTSSISNVTSNEPRQKRKRDDRLSLKTSSQDYGSNLGLPDKIEQREYETTGQFFRRLDRLVAKARVEANLETRFDMTIDKGQKPFNTKTEATGKGVASDKVDDSQQKSGVGRRSHNNKRKKRLKR